MNEEYLKSREHIQAVRHAISVAHKLEMAEYGIREFTPQFIEASKAISDEIGIELWHTDAHGGTYFWKHGKRESIKYESRVTALRALLDEEIRWTK